jgi:hypothetical protein
MSSWYRGIFSWSPIFAPHLISLRRLQIPSFVSVTLGLLFAKLVGPMKQTSITACHLDHRVDAVRAVRSGREREGLRALRLLQIGMSAQVVEIFDDILGHTLNLDALAAAPHASVPRVPAGSGDVDDLVAELPGEPDTVAAFALA